MLEEVLRPCPSFGQGVEVILYHLKSLLRAGGRRDSLSSEKKGVASGRKNIYLNIV